MIPSTYRKKLGISAGSELLVRLEGNRLSVQTKEQARREAQDFVCSLASKVSLSEELIAERRREALKEL